MVSVIVLENGASESEVRSAVTALGASPKTQVILVASAIAAMHGVSHVVRERPGMFGEALRTAAELATTDSLLIIDSAAQPSAKDIANSIVESATTSATALLPQSSASGSTSPLQLDRGTAVNILGAAPFALDTAISAFKREFLLSQNVFAERWSETLLRIAIAVDCDEFNTATIAISADTQSTPVAQTIAARVLRWTTDTVNIEELFPSHPWTRHEGESAAASFHTLAATFIRLNELDAAADCLRISDELEDSPRSLALKGLIQQERGEVLGAVANMVSSLNQYEARKSADGTHYLHFAPRDVEAIQSKLQAGLSALNKKNNTLALECFSEAVDCFDAFYEQHGLLRRNDAASSRQ